MGNLPGGGVSGATEREEFLFDFLTELRAANQRALCGKVLIAERQYCKGTSANRVPCGSR